jgi:septum formation protein
VVGQTKGMAEIYLASRSSRRRELLHQIGVRFETLLLRVEPRRPADVDETQRGSESAYEYVERIAREKALAGRRVLQSRTQLFRPVLAADTVVVLDGEVLGKPADREQAAEYLQRLSGRTHEVRTVVALAASTAPNSEPLMATSVSRVTMRLIEGEEIERYCTSNEPMDKAGGYAIQGKAAVFIERLEGSYSGVVGLPLAETASLLIRGGIRVL